MRSVGLWAAGFALALASAAPAAGQDPGSGGAAEFISIRVCNNTDTAVRVAISYQPIGEGRFYNEGWYGVQPQACADLARTQNVFSYVYAEVANDGTRSWSGAHPHCVQYPGPYAFWSGNAGVCAAGQQARNFVPIEMERWGVYTWTLDP